MRFAKRATATRVTLRRLVGVVRRASTTGCRRHRPNFEEKSLQSARTNLVAASTNNTLGSRQNQIGLAINALDLADTEIAPNITFTIGSGTPMN